MLDLPFASICKGAMQCKHMFSPSGASVVKYHDVICILLVCNIEVDFNDCIYLTQGSIHVSLCLKIKVNDPARSRQWDNIC